MFGYVCREFHEYMEKLPRCGEMFLEVGLRDSFMQWFFGKKYRGFSVRTMNKMARLAYVVAWFGPLIEVSDPWISERSYMQPRPTDTQRYNQMPKLIRRKSRSQVPKE